MKYKGLSVFVYRNTLGDCTNNGISCKQDRLILVGPGCGEVFEGDETNTIVVKTKIFSGKSYTYAEPAEQPKGMAGPMFGGNFAFTSDSRMPNHAPIPIHDRFETWETYEHLSR